MKKTLKIVLISLGILVALLVIVGGVALLSLDSMLETGVRKGGSYALKTPVELESAKLSVVHGTVSLKGFSVANPQGFDPGKALSFSEVSAGVEPGSIFEEVIVVPEVVIRRPEVSIVGSLKDGSNIQKLLKNLDETVGSSGGAKEPGTPARPDAPAQAPADEGPGRGLKIGRILIEDAKVSLGADILGGEPASVTLPKLEIKDIGTGPDGSASPAEVAQKVLSAILAESAKSSGKLGDVMRQINRQAGVVKQIGGELQEMGKGLGKEIGDDLKNAGGSVKDAGKNLKDTGKGLMNDVKGIFNTDGKSTEKE